MTQTPFTIATRTDLDKARSRPRGRSDRTFAKRMVGAAALGVAAVLATAASARADLIDVQFEPTGQTAYSGAGVLGASGDQWNVITASGNHILGSINNIPLDDASSSATSVLLSISTIFAAFEYESGGIFGGTTYQNLLTSYLESDGHALTVALSGLTPDASYELVLYSVANQVGRSTQFTVDGTSETVTPTSTQLLTEGVNYAEFTAMADASGDFSVTAASPTHGEGDLNGFQLLQLPAAVPEPTSIALFGTALIGLGLLGRRRGTPARRLSAHSLAGRKSCPGASRRGSASRCSHSCGGHCRAVCNTRRMRTISPAMS